MKQCWLCRTVTSKISQHHINRNNQDNKFYNLINLCPKCHNLVQGICDKCADQKDCHNKKFQQCWAFNDSLPPIYFKSQNDENEKNSMISVYNDASKKKSQNKGIRTLLKGIFKKLMIIYDFDHKIQNKAIRTIFRGIYGVNLSPNFSFLR